MNLTTLLCITLLGAPQGPGESAGPMVGVPHTVSVSVGTTGGGPALSESQVWFKEPGVGPGTPVAMGLDPTRPDFRINSILGMATGLPDLDAMSIGLDWILADDEARAVVPSGGWGMISFSVGPGAGGIPGSLINAEATIDGAAADVFTWLLPGSAAPPGWVGELQRGQNSDEVNLGGTVGNIDAHDVFIAGYRLAPGIVAMLPGSPTFFFSVSTATLGKTPAAWWGASTKSGASILMTTWDPTARKWSPVTVFLKHSELGLAATEEVDALAVDPIRTRLMFSTDTASRDEFLVAIPKGGKLVVKTYTLNDAGRTPVSKAVGLLKTDHVDAICALDPNRGRAARYLQTTLGRALVPRLVPSLPDQLTATAFRSFDAVARRDVLHSVLNGWPRPGRPQPSLTIVGMSFPTAPSIPIAVLGQQVRTPILGRFRGGPMQFRIGIPQLHSATGIPVHFLWITGETNGPFVALPHPVEIRL